MKVEDFGTRVLRTKTGYDVDDLKHTNVCNFIGFRVDLILPRVNCKFEDARDIINVDCKGN